MAGRIFRADGTEEFSRRGGIQYKSITGAGGSDLRELSSAELAQKAVDDTAHANRRARPTSLAARVAALEAR